MNVEIIQLYPTRVLMIRHQGAYEGISTAFEKLCNWADQSGVQYSRVIGIYYDNPDYVPAAQLRSAACIEVAPGLVLPDFRGLRIEDSMICGGQYGTITVVGPYEGLAMAWTQLTISLEKKLGKTIREDDPAFEVYVNDAETTPPDQLITELYMPIA
jgi:AraC family transcriptional regulator